MSSHAKSRKAVVVGAGPVGCLTALSLAKMGWAVQIYEGREDMRKPSAKAKASLRSINLAISARGIAALNAVEPQAAERFLSDAIPMKGRMIHDRTGRQQSQLYDRNGQCINSIDRGLLNEGLLDSAFSHPGIEVFFEHKLVVADFDAGTLTFKDAVNNVDIDVTFDFCVGADGSYSNVRRQLMRVVRMNFEQTYIPHEYLELKMPAADDNGKKAFALDPDHLHIWPRSSFMLIALPNQDRTFTCTLFAPTADFDKLTTGERPLDWFRKEFPDALTRIGEEGVIESFRNNPRSPLIAIKANPYHYKDRVVILGDAAHSMVPFYGQGLNCGLEDVRVLDVILREEGVDPTEASHTSASIDSRMANALRRYSETRHKDLVAISDLAMKNYVEMRHSVTTPSYLFFRALDNLFAFLTSPFSSGGPNNWNFSVTELAKTTYPTRSTGGWHPLYTMVTFRPDISYSAAQAKAERQQAILSSLGVVGMAMGTVGIGFSAFRLLQRLRGP